MTNILVGADPEVVLYQHGKPVSAHGVIEGNKANPFKVRNGAVQVDGMLLEFNIDPANTEEEFTYNIKEVLSQLKAMVDGEVVATPVASFGKAYIDAQPEEAKELGCEPDFNAWNGIENARPDGGLGIRTGAGHVHLGWTNDKSLTDGNHMQLVHTAMKQLDFFLALPSVLYDDYTERRMMYGRAGAYRPKSYGAEYRTLSNMWLTSDVLIRLVYQNIQKAFNCLRQGRNLTDKYGDIQQIINTSDKQRALAIIREEGITYV